MTMKQCPVCGMDASTSEITTEHMGISYRFCSLQCMENFAVKSPKRQGKSVIKKRSFTLETPISKSGLDALETDICNMMGIRGLQVSGTKVSVTYDLLEATAIQVEQCLEQAGAKLGAGWADRFKRGWIHYTEENELDHLAATGAACCNKPPVTFFFATGQRSK